MIRGQGVVAVIGTTLDKKSASNISDLLLTVEIWLSPDPVLGCCQSLHQRTQIHLPSF